MGKDVFMDGELPSTHWQQLTGSLPRLQPRSRLAVVHTLDPLTRRQKQQVRAQRTLDNPWGLSAAQCEVLEALAAVWETKAVAVRLALAPNTVDNYVYEACKRMEMPNRLAAVLAWDRWRRANHG